MKELLLTLLILILTISLNARQVSRQQALQKVQIFKQGKQFGEEKAYPHSEGLLRNKVLHSQIPS